MDRIPLGESRREAISRVQERLGPATSRPLAEQTFWSLARKGKITMDKEGTYLIEAGVEDDSLRGEATNILKQQYQHVRTPRRGRMFQINHNNTHKARVSTAWQAATKTLFAPTLEGAEGYQPDLSVNLDDDSDQDTE